MKPLLKNSMEKYYQKTLCKNCGREFNVYVYNLRKGFGKFCSKGCSNSFNKQGFKEGHGSFWTQASRNKFRATLHREKHHGWKSEHAGKGAKHAFVARHKGKPNKCEHCGSASKKRIYDWANVDHKYSRNLNDYIRLCRSCHRKYD